MRDGYLVVSNEGTARYDYERLVTVDPAAVAALIYWGTVKWSNR